MGRVKSIRAAAARIRQAKDTNNQLKKEVEVARLRVHADVISVGPCCNRPPRRANPPRMRSEPTGSRLEGCALDVLNAGVLGSQIQLVTAKRDRVVVEYSVYSSIGRLDARNLGLSVPYYEPLVLQYH
jgi:outer membrane protein